MMLLFSATNEETPVTLREAPTLLTKMGAEIGKNSFIVLIS